MTGLTLAATNMFLSRITRGAIVATLALSALDCAKTDAASVSSKPSAAATNASVATTKGAGMAGKLTDSISTRADLGRIRGAESAPIWLVEISDFQCPYCKKWHDETFAAIDKEFVQTGQVRLAYLNFPIPSLHPNARAASEAAMCASVQNHFWEMHESLFDKQQEWAALPDPSAVFETLAIAAGVNPANWRSCMQSHATLPLIDADRGRVGDRGVQSTPTFFVGARMIAGAYPADSFRVIIREQLAKAMAKK